MPSSRAPQLVCSAATFGFQYKGLYWSDAGGASGLGLRLAWPYIAFATTASQLVALYCLLLLHRGFRQQLGPLAAGRKIAVVLIVIFATFWQSLLLLGLVRYRLLKESPGSWGDSSVKQVSDGLANLLICFEARPAGFDTHVLALQPIGTQSAAQAEVPAPLAPLTRPAQMLALAFAMAVTFSPTDFPLPSAPPPPMRERLWQMVAVGDAWDDACHAAGYFLPNLELDLEEIVDVRAWFGGYACLVLFWSRPAIALAAAPPWQQSHKHFAPLQSTFGMGEEALQARHSPVPHNPIRCVAAEDAGKPLSRTAGSQKDGTHVVHGQGGSPAGAGQWRQQRRRLQQAGLSIDDHNGINNLNNPCLRLDLRVSRASAGGVVACPSSSFRLGFRSISTTRLRRQDRSRRRLHKCNPCYVIVC